MPNESKVGIVIEAQDRATAQLKRVEGSLGRIQRRMKSMRPTFQKMAFAGTAAFAGLSFGVLKATQASADAQEIMSKFGVVFDEVGEKAEAVAEDFRVNFGLAGSTAKKLLSDTGDLLTGFGFTGAGALKLAEDTNRLAIDLASFTNVEGGAERASKALTKALLGERESVKELGIAILESDVKAAIAAKGLENLTGLALRQARAQVTLEIAISQSKNAIGDFARTSESTANQQKILGERIKELTETFGTAFEPMLNDILHALIPIVEKTGRWIEQNPELTKKIALTVIGVAGLVGALGFLGLAVLSVSAGVTALGITMAGVLTISGIGLVIAGIALIANNLKGIIEVLFDVEITWKEIWNSIIDFTSDLIVSLMGKIQPVITALSKIKDIAGGFVSNVRGGAVELAGDALNLFDGNNDINSTSPSLGGSNFNFDFRGATVADKDNFVRDIKKSFSRDLQLSTQGL